MTTSGYVCTLKGQNILRIEKINKIPDILNENSWIFQLEFISE